MTPCGWRPQAPVHRSKLAACAATPALPPAVRAVPQAWRTPSGPSSWTSGASASRCGRSLSGGGPLRACPSTPCRCGVGARARGGGPRLGAAALEWAAPSGKGACPSRLQFVAHPSTAPLRLPVPSPLCAPPCRRSGCRTRTPRACRPSGCQTFRTRRASASTVACRVRACVWFHWFRCRAAAAATRMRAPMGHAPPSLLLHAYYACVHAYAPTVTPQTPAPCPPPTLLPPASLLQMKRRPS